MIYLQWQETVESSRRRDELISETGEDYGSSKDFLDRKKAELETHKSRLEREKENNKGTEGHLARAERELTQLRENMSRSDQAKSELEGNVAIQRNQLSAFATELANKRAAVANVNKVLGQQMERLEAAKKKFQATKDRLAREANAQDRLCLLYTSDAADE